MLSSFKDFDFYRKIPKDLTETTPHGSVLSICASAFMLVLFIAEVWAFLSARYVTNVVIDPRMDALLQINFNVTLMDIPCEFATVDVIDVLGTRKDNITKNIDRWQIDETGDIRVYEGRNVEQKDVEHEDHHVWHELVQNGLHAPPISHDQFDEWLSQHHYTFVDFYAPWCIWCQRLEPVWEAFAEQIEREQLPISIVKVDCVVNQKLCEQQRIQAFPTLRLFKDDVAQSPDYRSDRIVDALMTYSRSKLSDDENLAAMPPIEREAAHLELNKLHRANHPGCLMSGFLLVNRVPGDFHIQARSKHHNLNPVMANLSHIVNHLSFGPVLSKHATRRMEEIPSKLFTSQSMQPMDGNIYVNKKLHQAFHHYIKVVATQVDTGGRYHGVNAIQAYQVVQSSQVMQYKEREVPEARFGYDISPMAVSISKKGKHWYEFVTSMCALIGGSFTVLGLLSGFLGIIFKVKNI